jgi:hypothetical protein
MIVRRVCALGLGLAACVTASSAQDAVAQFQGKWTVTDVVGYADTSGGVPEAKTLLGKVLTVTNGQIEFAGERCAPNGGFNVSTVETAPKLRDYYGVVPEDVGLPAKTALLDSSNCTAVFRLDAHRVVFGWDGVVLRAIKP